MTPWEAWMPPLFRFLVLLLLPTSALAQCDGPGSAPRPTTATAQLVAMELVVTVIPDTASFNDTWAIAIAVDNGAPGGWDVEPPCATGHTYDWVLAMSDFTGYPNPAPTWFWSRMAAVAASDTAHGLEPVPWTSESLGGMLTLHFDCRGAPIFAGQPYALIVDEIIHDTTFGYPPQPGAILPVELRRHAWVYQGTL